MDCFYRLLQLFYGLFSSGRVRTKCATNCKLVRTRCTVDCKLQYSNPSVDRRWTHVRTSSDGLQIPPCPSTVIGRVRSQLRTNCKLHPVRPSTGRLRTSSCKFNSNSSGRVRTSRPTTNGRFIVNSYSSERVHQFEARPDKFGQFANANSSGRHLTSCNL